MLIGGLLIIVAATIGIVVAYRNGTTVKSSPSTSTTASNTLTPAPTSTSTPSGSTTNSDLQTDLNDVNSSLGQSQQTLNATSTAVNDQQKQITVPTN